MDGPGMRQPLPRPDMTGRPPGPRPQSLLNPRMPQPPMQRFGPDPVIPRPPMGGADICDSGLQPRLPIEPQGQQFGMLGPPVHPGPHPRMPGPSVQQMEPQMPMPSGRNFIKFN